MSALISRDNECDRAFMRLSTHLTICQEMCDIELLDVQGLDRGVDEIADNGGGRILDCVFCGLEVLLGFVDRVPGSILCVLRGALSRAFGVVGGIRSFVFSIVKDTPSEDLVQVDRSIGSGKVQIFE